MSKNLTEEPLRIQSTDPSSSQGEHRYVADAAVKNRLLKYVLRPMALLTFGILGGIEKILWPGTVLRYSPVFIVAPPRSGTTLLYQLMTGYMATCYFSNLAQRLRVHGSEIMPAFSACLVKYFKLDQRQDESFKSYYGATTGWGAPNEANGIWERWFPETHHHIAPGHLSSRAQQGIYRAVAATERVFDRPFVNKCIRNSVRIEALAEIFPRALFIQCTRNRLDTAQSIWIARTKTRPFESEEMNTSFYPWWSVKPKEYASIRHKKLVAQVCEQVFFVEQSIVAAREALGENRFLVVDYQDLCQKPRYELDRIVQFMNDRGAPTQVTRLVPESFQYSTGQKVSDTDYRAMTDYLSQLYERPMGIGDV